MTGIDFQHMLESLGEAVVVADTTQRVLYLNPAAERLLGWPSGELSGQPLVTLIPPRLQDAHQQGFARYIEAHGQHPSRTSMRVPALRRDGTEIDIELSLNSLHLNGSDLIVAAVHGMGDRAEVERQADSTRYLRATARAAVKFGARLGLEQLLESVVDTLVAEFDSALARVWLYEQSSHQLVLRASAGLSRETSNSSRARIDLNAYPYKVGTVARSGKAIIRNGLTNDPEFEQDWVQREHIAGAAILPLTSGGELKGVLAHFSRKPMHAELIEALTTFTAIVSVALNDVLLFEREQAARVEAEDERRRLQTILDMLPLGVILAEGPEGRLTFINPAGEDMWALPFSSCALAELPEKLPFFTMEGRPCTLPEHPLWRALEKNLRVREMMRYRRPDGQERVLDVVAAPFMGPRGGAVATLRDVTARLRMESELSERAAQFKALLDHLPVGVAYFDDKCICRAANGPARDILSRTHQEVTGVAASALYAGAPEALLAALERCVREQLPHVEQSVPWPDQDDSASGRFLDWRFEPLPASASRLPGALALVADVTQRKRAEDDLKLAKEAAELTAINKTRFLSAVSHDLRTPVNALSLLAELLCQVVADREDPEDQLGDIAKDIRLAAANLIELINDLLDLARFDSGDVEHYATSFSLQDWLATTLEPLELTARAKGLNISWHVDRRGRVVHADRVKLSRVLTNLVGNAVKFTDAGAVTIDVGATPDGWLQLRVADTGPGIPGDQLERIFDEFAQLRNPERDRTKGTGLGLAICKRLVEAVGGHLEVSSRLGEGSSFSAFYPADHLGDTELDLPQLSGRRSTRVAPHAPILVVEDDPRSRQALERLLQKAGYSVVTAADGPCAIATVTSERPSLVLLDLMLPGMDGTELLRWFRQQPDCESLPVLLLSGDVISGSAEVLKDLNVAGMLSKPVDFDALLATIARHVHPAGSAG